jgi:hypothetical protein
MRAISSIQLEEVMYARITTYHCKPEMLGDAIALAEKMKPEIIGIHGLRHWFSTGNEDGNCALIGIYENREAAEAATDTVRAFFARFAEYIDSEPQPLGYEVLLHGANT